MPTTSLNCKVCSDNIKSIQNPTSIKNSFPVPPILTSTPPSHHQDKVSSTDSGWSCQEWLALVLRHQSRSAGQRCPRPGRLAHGFRQASPTRRGLRWHKDWNLPTLDRAGVEGCLRVGGFVHPDHPEAWSLPLRLHLSRGSEMDWGGPTLSTGLCLTWTVGKLLKHLLTLPAVKKKILYRTFH